MATQGKILVYKRESKKGVTYTYRIEAGRDPITGKRKQVTKSGFKSAKEARAAAQPILNKLLLGENIVESDITFGEYAEQYLKDKRINLKPSTQDNISEAIKIANRYFFSLKLKNITPYIYQKFINDYSSKVCLNTVQHRHIIIKNIFSHAVKFNIIHSNPAINIEFSKKNINQKEVTDLYLTKDELNNFLSFLEHRHRTKMHNYFYPLCVLLAYTGMRVGEACGLTWEDINFEKRTIFIHSTMYAKNYNNYKRLDTPKNQTSIRKIFIDEYLISILKEWRKLQLTTRMKNGINNKIDVENFVFTTIGLQTKKEKAVVPIAVAAAFKHINRKKLYPKHVHAHMLRHTHVSLLAETKQVSLIDIQARLGHGKGETTTRIYLHVTERSKLDTAKIFEEYMSK